jgi:hypothetical protein
MIRVLGGAWQATVFDIAGKTAFSEKRADEIVRSASVVGG